MDNQQRQDNFKEQEELPPEERPFDPWEQAFNRDFRKHERDFEF
ncbi:hypothetical protein [Ensifer sp. B1-9]